jgi:hypothetical protein
MVRRILAPPDAHCFVIVPLNVKFPGDVAQSPVAPVKANENCSVDPENPAVNVVLKVPLHEPPGTLFDVSVPSEPAVVIVNVPSEGNPPRLAQVPDAVIVPIVTLAPVCVTLVDTGHVIEPPTVVNVNVIVPA